MQMQHVPVAKMDASGHDGCGCHTSSCERMSQAASSIIIHPSMLRRDGEVDAERPRDRGTSSRRQAQACPWPGRR